MSFFSLFFGIIEEIKKIFETFIREIILLMFLLYSPLEKILAELSGQVDRISTVTVTSLLEQLNFMVMYIIPPIRAHRDFFFTGTLMVIGASVFFFLGLRAFSLISLISSSTKQSGYSFFSMNTLNRIGRYLDKIVSLLFYNILLALWERANDYMIFKKPLIIREYILDVYKRIKKLTSPVYNLFLQNRGSKLLHASGREELIELMDEGKKTSRIALIPPELTEAFMEKKGEKGWVIPESWDTALGRIKSRLENNNITTQAVCGYEGCGKTSFISYLKNNITGYPVFFIQVKRNENLFDRPELADVVSYYKTGQTRLEKKVIILDDIELSFLKTIGGYETIRELFLLIEKTKKQVTWIFSFNPLFFSLLKYILPAFGLIQFIYDFSDIDGDIIGRIIRGKAQGLGYEIKIIPDKVMLSRVQKMVSGKYLAREEIGEYLINSYIKKNMETGSNNLNFHFFYFLRSVKNIKNKSIYLIQSPILDLSLFEKLPLESCFILEAIMLHKYVTTGDMCRILLISEKKAELVMKMLTGSNILREKNGLFSVYPPVYNQVLAFLQKKYIIET